MSGYTIPSPLPLFEQPSEDPREHLVGPDDDGRWLELLRDELRKLYLERKSTWTIAQGDPFVCADDARRLIEKDSALRPPPHRSNNALGSLFLVPGWRKVGKHISTTSGSHRNEINTWAWVGDE